MVRYAGWFILVACCSPLPGQVEQTDALLVRIRSHMKSSLEMMPDYVCLQTVERATRRTAKIPFEVRDTLRLEVGSVGDKEIFAWRDSARFSERELSDMVGNGTVGNGNFVLHARNVFLSDAPDFVSRGEEDLGGRPAIRYDFDVARERSSFRIRVPPKQALVPFHGTFWVDPTTLDLLRLEINVEDIPENIGVVRLHDVMTYARTPIGSEAFLLPQSSELFMAGWTGDESRNRTQFHSCRQYSGQSSLSFDEAPSSPAVAASTLPDRTVLELSLETEIDLENVALGDTVRAVLAKPIRDGDTVLVAAGTPVRGRVVRVDKEALPKSYFVLGIELDSMTLDGRDTPLYATMIDAEPTQGLMRQEKRLMPTFTKQRTSRMDILVREQQKGQGILNWDAKHPRIRRGLRMRWQVGTTGPPVY